jgi:hypothetical protein
MLVIGTLHEHATVHGEVEQIHLLFTSFLHGIFYQLEQDEIVENLDQAKSPKWNEAMLAVNIEFLR